MYFMQISYMITQRLMFVKHQIPAQANQPAHVHTLLQFTKIQPTLIRQRK